MCRWQLTTKKILIFWCLRVVFMISDTINKRAPFSLDNRTDGAQTTSIFWASFTLGRLTTVFLSMCVNPLHTIAICFFLGIVGATGLVFTAQHSLILLQVGTYN